MAFSDSSKFEEIMDKIKYLINWYESKHIDQTSSRLYLASGESFKFIATKDSIAHMLGIKTNFLATCGMFNTTKSYDLIKELIENQYRISSKILNNEIKLSDVFNKHIHRKLAIFKSNISFNLNNVLFICKYDRNKVIEYGGTPRNCDYIIVKETDDGQIQELDIVLSGKIAKPVSSRLYENEQEAKDDFEQLLKYQEISILTFISLNTDYYDIDKRVKLSEKDRISKLQEIETLSLKYNCTVNVVGDCKHYYKLEINGKSNYDIYSKITNCISEGKIIDIKELGISPSEVTYQLQNLIEAHNDRIFMELNENNNGEKYSELVIKIERLKEEKRILLDKKNKLTNKLAETTIERDELKDRDNHAKELVKTLTAALNTYNKKEDEENE